MEEGEKGLLMGAAVFAFLAAAMLARSIFVQVDTLQETVYDRNQWQRNVVIVSQKMELVGIEIDSWCVDSTMRGEAYG